MNSLPIASSSYTTVLRLRGSYLPVHVQNADTNPRDGALNGRALASPGPDQAAMCRIAQVFAQQNHLSFDNIIRQSQKTMLGIVEQQGGD